MGLRHFDHDYLEEVVVLLGKLPDDTKPRWGVMDKAALIRHLVWVLRHSMGRSTKVPYMGNWFLSTIARPIMLSGFIPIPKNAKLPSSLEKKGVKLEEPGDLETLHAIMEEYVAMVQADELRPAKHPLFGELGVDGWDRMHVMHFEHHLKQFGVR